VRFLIGEFSGPANYIAIYPLAENDKGQILVNLWYKTGGGYHWGILNPIAAAVHPARR
jgi:hypothetical protein